MLNNPADWYIEPKESGGRKRKSAPTGSLEAIDYLAQVEADTAAEIANRDRINSEKEAAAREAQIRLETFILCQHGCKCELDVGEVCRAKGLKQCDICGRVLKSKCTLKACVEARKLAFELAMDGESSSSGTDSDDFESENEGEC